MSTRRSPAEILLLKRSGAITFLTGLLALLWLLLRSGTKPDRLSYPCQQAAFTTASLALGAPVVAALAATRRFAGRLAGNRLALATVAAVVFVTFGLHGVLSHDNAGRSPLAEPPAGYRATVFQVTDSPRDPVGDRFVGLDNLFELMGREGLKIYKSPTQSRWSGPDGIIGSDDVVVIKINYQWSGCGGTNTDLLRGLIRVLVDHPDGFTGEIVVGENTQFASADGFDRGDNNALDPSLSPHDVVEGFQNQGYRTSHSDWSQVRTRQIDESSACDQGSGYVVVPTGTTGRISYPVFQTQYGTCVSLGRGVWDPSVNTYTRARLKVINLPVLKPHGYQYAVTACVKNYMGLVTNELDTNSHDGVRDGLMGAVMAEIGLPDLNILDCTRVVANPRAGPGVSCQNATRLDRLVASKDPIAADIWATTNILIPAFLANGHTPPWPDPDATPDDPDSVFRTYLDNSMDELLVRGYSVTNDLDNIDAYSWNGAREPRRPSGRIGN